ncbi:pitrilysin family protein [uncultured Paludibaculum sp.]|uniref:M16 family metallopeptidase n=1 Tax=uncultured Paludibaculum sp. TaxID=1765020 RepID=UPI002AABAA45|nr:pitrilysin family protein [uncultured Paludibaculum sp.]
MNFITRPDSTPLISLRVVFQTGSAQDPPVHGGTAWMVGMMLASGGSRTQTYKQILDALFPMGVSIGCQVSKEQITFTAEVHRDHIDAFYDIFRAMLLDPGWRDDDFARLTDDAVNLLEVELRGQNDEELAKEILYQRIYQGHPYGRYDAGTVSSLQSLKLDDLKQFYLAEFASSNLTIAIGGGYPEGFEQRLRKDFSSLPLRARSSVEIPPAPPIGETELYLLEKPARGVAISLGFPLAVRRGHPDFPALLLAASALGQHRMSSGRLFTRMRQHRGLNYGDYAYIEYFPGGMYTLEPSPNHARANDIFQLWIRPVDRDQAHFALRLALHELERFVREGLTQDEFDRSRSFLSKYVNLLLKTKSEELGYAVDSAYYGIQPYPEYVRTGLSQLTRDQVNAAIKRHLRADRLKIVAVGEGMADFRQAILENRVAPMTYNSPKPEEILEEDKIVERRQVEVRPESALIVEAATAFNE